MPATISTASSTTTSTITRTTMAAILETVALGEGALVGPH